MILRLSFFVFLPTLLSARFFDVCPSRRISIGSCLAGLCPSGSECINNYCCRIKTTTPSTEEQEIEENVEFGKCPNGKHAIGECISDICPKGYRCLDGLCCKGNGLLITTPIRITMAPMTTSTTPMSTETSTEVKTTTSVPSRKAKLFTTTSTTTTTTTSEEEELTTLTEVEEEDLETTTTNSEENEITEIESMKNKFKGIKPKENSEEDEEEYTSSTLISRTTTDGEYTSEETSDKEEVDDTTTTTMTTPMTTPTTASSEETTLATTKRTKTRAKKPRPYTSSTFIPEAESEEEEEKEEEKEKKEEKEESTEDNSSSLCPVGMPIGECVSGQCPEGHGCYNNNCCILTPQINCTDALPTCQAHLCLKRGYKEFMTKNCARTCARCHMVDLMGPELAECRDRRTDCDEWAREGFCDSTLYTTRQKLKFCGKSCKLC